MPIAPMGPVQIKKHGGRTTGEPEQRRLSLRSGFTAYFVLSPVTGLCLSPSPPRSLLLEGLNASIGAPGPHDFAVRGACARLSRAVASTASRRNVGDVRNAPLIGRDGRIKLTDLPDDESGIFLREGLDRFLLICPSGWFVAGAVSQFGLRAKRCST